MARAPVSKTGGWGFDSLHSCHKQAIIPIFIRQELRVLGFFVVLDESFPLTYRNNSAKKTKFLTAGIPHEIVPILSTSGARN